MLRKVLFQFTCSMSLLALIVGCGMKVPAKKQSEVEQLYEQARYQDAMNVARYNLSPNNNPKDPGSIVVVWKVQVIQGTQSAEYVQSFYSQAQSRVTDFGPALIPYLCRGFNEDSYNTVRLFCLYSLSEFEDSSAVNCVAKVFDPGYTLGIKPSDVSLDYLRAEAAMILGSRKYEPAYDGIVSLLGNESIEIRNKAAQALGLLGDKRAIEPLEAMKKALPSSRDGIFAAEMADTSIAKLKRAN